MTRFGRLSLIAALAGCSSSPTRPDPDVPVGTRQVLVVDNAFEPPHNFVSEGDTVTWSWTGAALHNVTFDDAELPDSPTQRQGSHAVVFAVPGGYDYHCTVHGRNAMSGRVTVERSTQRPDPGDPVGR